MRERGLDNRLAGLAPVRGQNDAACGHITLGEQGCESGVPRRLHPLDSREELPSRGVTTPRLFDRLGHDGKDVKRGVKGLGQLPPLFAGLRTPPR